MSELIGKAVFASLIISLASAATAAAIVAAVPPVVTPPKPPPIAPTTHYVRPPINNAATKAIQFTIRVSTMPQCQHFVVEANAVFIDGRTSVDEKTRLLENIEWAVKAANCLMPA